MKFILGMGHYIPRKPTINISAHYRTRPAKSQRRHHNNNTSSPQPTESSSKPQPQPQPQPQSPYSSSPPPARDQPCKPPKPETPESATPPRPTSASPASAGASVPPTVPLPSSRSRTLRQTIRASAIGRAGAFYSRVQSRRPYLTQLVCTLFIYLCGDLSAQVLVPSLAGVGDDEEERLDNSSKTGGDDVERTKKVGYDPLRTARHLTVGAIACVPSYEWFMFLHRNFNYASKPLSILLKVLVSQIVYTPFFNTYFFSLQSLLAGSTISETVELVQKAVPTSILNSVKLWPAVTAFMFMYVDPQFRNIFAGGIAVGWQTYLSWLNQKAAREIRLAEVLASQNQEGKLAAVG